MPADIATLLAEAPWLERLARSLTGDPVEADDLVQDTYAAALRSPPDTDRPIRPWLRRVAINLARMRHRVRTTRAATESVVETQAEPVRDAEQLLERARLERRLAELVLELDEPFRTTVLLRYREGLSAEQIANQQGIPAGTVRSRLKTGLDRLRRELADDERGQLRALFAPLAVAARPAPARAVGRIVMAKLTSKLAIVIAVVLLLVAGTWLVWPRSSRAPRGTHDIAAASIAHEAARALIARPAMFVQAGVAARRLNGRVTSDGAPFRGAVVQLVHGETEVVLAEVRSGGNGTFDFGDRPADRYIVTASAPARTAVPVRVDLRMPSAVDVELRLTGCSHVRGMVVDGSGSPIDHARIGRVDAPGAFAETDATGRYDLCTHYGSVSIRYSASGYHSVVVDLDVAANTKRDVVLIPEAIVEGTVVDESGAAVAGAWVIIDPNQIGGSERDARAVGFSAPDGSFRITAVAPGRNLIAAFAPGLRSPHKQELVTGAGQVRSGVVVRVARTAMIAGIVVAGATPVAGVGVGMKIGNRDETGILAVTQADGSFVIDRAPRGDVGLYVENHTVITPRSVHVGDQPPRVRIEVQRMGNVRGRVLRGNEPVADAQVSCLRRPKVFTDASGNYACDGLDNGEQEVFADVSTGEWGHATVMVTRGETVNLDISLTFAGAICGRVVDQNGQGLSGLEVRVAERTTGDFGKDTTAADGAFCTRLLTGGTYGVAVFAGPRPLVPIVPLAPVMLGPKETKTLTIAVTAPTLTISGMVSDPHGAPVVDAIVRLLPADKRPAPMMDSRGPGLLALTDEVGRFMLSKLAAGDYTIIATARDGSEVMTPPVAAGSRDVAITLAAAGRIEGQLVGFTSAPTITGTSLSGRGFVDVEVDGQRFRASGLSPGTYVLMALTDAREADTRQVVVRAGETTRATLTNRGTTTISGVVRDFRTRAPVAGQRCASFARDGDAMGAIYAGPDEGALTDERGAFQLISPAGEIEIGCGGPGHHAARVLVAPRDRTITIDVFGVAITQEPGTIDAELAFASNRITEVTKGGAANRAGLTVGDEILAVDGLSVVDLAAGTAMLVITQRPAGTTAQLTILRGGERRTVTVTVRDAT